MPGEGRPLPHRLRRGGTTTPQQHYHQTNATTAARAGRRADKSEIQPAVWQQRNPRAAQYDLGGLRSARDWITKNFAPMWACELEARNPAKKLIVKHEQPVLQRVEATNLEQGREGNQLPPSAILYHMPCWA